MSNLFGRRCGTNAFLGFTLLALGVTGCNNSDATGPDIPTDGSLTVNAATDWAYVKLGETAQQVMVTDPSTSGEWDVAFYGTSVMLNGGAAGPGGVLGYCACQNQAATDAQVQAMTPESQLSSYTTVASSGIPVADSLWQGDALAAAVAGWFSYNPVTHVVSATPGRSWKVRTASGSAYAKVRITNLENPARTDAGKVTLEFAVQSARGAAMGATRSLTVDLSSSARVRVDLETGTVTSGSDWDLQLEGYTIRVNGGVSGSGAAGAVLITDAFEAITDASDLSDSPTERIATAAFST